MVQTVATQVHREPHCPPGYRAVTWAAHWLPGKRREGERCWPTGLAWADFDLKDGERGEELAEAKLALLARQQDLGELPELHLYYLTRSAAGFHVVGRLRAGETLLQHRERWSDLLELEADPSKGARYSDLAYVPLGLCGSLGEITVNPQSQLEGLPGNPRPQLEGSNPKPQLEGLERLARAIEQRHGTTLRLRADQYEGACPRCGGQDRFRLNIWPETGATTAHCRKCEQEGVSIHRWLQERTPAQQPQEGEDCVAAFLAGRRTRQQETAKPEPLVLTDDPEPRPWLYRRMRHTLAGHPGSGKTWAAYWAAAQLARTGGRTLIVDADYNQVHARLDIMGLDAEQADRHIVVYDAHTLWQDESPQHMAGAQQWLSEAQNSLVVLDSTGALGASPTGAAVKDWFAAHVEPFSRTAAVLLLDHKARQDAEGQRAGPAGSHQKTALVDLEWLAGGEPFTRQTPGTVTMRCTKDRTGHLPAGQISHALCGTPNEPDWDRLELALTADPERLGRQTTDAAAALLLRLVEQDPGQTKRHYHRQMGSSAPPLSDLCGRLERDGLIEVERTAAGHRLHLPSTLGPEHTDSW